MPRDASDTPVIGMRSPEAVQEEPNPPRLPVDPGLQPAIDDLILAGRFGDAIAAAREAYGLTLGEAFHGVLTGKRDLTT